MPSSTGNHNADVIPLPEWRAFGFVDEHGASTVLAWLDAEQVPAGARQALQLQIDLLEYAGPPALAAAVVSLGDEFYAIETGKGDQQVSLIFCFGPFWEKEITFLAAARLGGKRRNLRLADALDMAEDSLRILKADRNRRRHERYSRT